MYGWRAFDPAVVVGITKRSAEHVVGGPEGGMACPIAAHGPEWLRWREGGESKGTVPHGRPSVSFRLSPTYVLSDRLDNFIVGRESIREAIDGAWGKAETHRLGHENSEDALTWNVLRSFQEAGELRLVASLLAGANSDTEPDLYFWGRHVRSDGTTAKWGDLQRVRRLVEPTHRQQTEPDACLHVPGWGWIFIEAKFGFGIATSGTAERMKRWLAVYPAHAPSVLDLKALAQVEPKEFPEQLLRNIVFAELIRERGERAHVVALVRARDKTPIDDWVTRCLGPACEVSSSRATWEEIYRVIPSGSSSLSSLRRYMEDKSHTLRRAFDLG